MWRHVLSRWSLDVQSAGIREVLYFRRFIFQWNINATITSFESASFKIVLYSGNNQHNAVWCVFAVISKWCSLVNFTSSREINILVYLFCLVYHLKIHVIGWLTKVWVFVCNQYLKNRNLFFRPFLLISVYKTELWPKQYEMSLYVHYIWTNI